MIAVVTNLILYKKKNKQKRPYTDSESKQIDRGDLLVLIEVSEDDKNVVF